MRDIISRTVERRVKGNTELKLVDINFIRRPLRALLQAPSSSTAAIDILQRRLEQATSVNEIVGYLALANADTIQAEIVLGRQYPSLFDRPKQELHDRRSSTFTIRYPCKICGEVYISRMERRTCEEKHTGKSSKECARCGKRFARPLNRRNHEKKCIGPMQCRGCQKRCLNLASLTKHLRICSQLDDSLRPRNQVHENQVPKNKVLKELAPKIQVPRNHVPGNLEEHQRECLQLDGSQRSREQGILVQNIVSPSPSINFPIMQSTILSPVQNSSINPKQDERYKLDFINCKEDQDPVTIHNGEGKQIMAPEVSDTEHGNVQSNRAFEQEPVWKRNMQTRDKQKEEVVYPETPAIIHKKVEHTNQGVWKREHKCPECEQFCGSPSSVNRHISAVHRPRQFLANGTCPCPKCPMIFDFPTKLARHMASDHSSVPHRCDVCKHRFASQDALDIHISQAHELVEVIECKLCNKRFTAAHGLLRHKKTDAHRLSLERIQ